MANGELCPRQNLQKLAKPNMTFADGMASFFTFYSIQKTSLANLELRLREPHHSTALHHSISNKSGGQHFPQLGNTGYEGK
jgi:hypothetical protein